MKATTHISRKTATFFADRVEPRDYFWTLYDEAKKNINTDELNKVLVFFGMGGIGKSTLLNKLIKELEVIGGLFIKIDFENITDPIRIMNAIKGELKKLGARFYLYETILARRRVVMKDNSRIDEAELAEKLSNKGIEEIADGIDVIAENADLFGPLGTVARLCKSSVTYAADKMRKKVLDVDERNELKRIAECDWSDIDKIIPQMLAKDINRFMQKKNVPLVIFIDTYENLPKNNKIATDWLFDDEYGIIIRMPKTIWVIGGRQEISCNNKLQEIIEQRNLKLLTEEDVDDYLNNSGITEPVFKDKIYSLTGGLPVYLDVCVDYYNRFLNKHSTITINDFGPRIEELVYRYLKYLDKESENLLYILASIGKWTDDLVEKILMDGANGFVFNELNYYDIIQERFVEKKDGIYMMQSAINKILLSSNNFPKLTAKKIQKLTILYYQDKINQGMLVTNSIERKQKQTWFNLLMEVVSRIFDQELICEVFDNIHKDLFNWCSCYEVEINEEQLFDLMDNKFMSYNEKKKVCDFLHDYCNTDFYNYQKAEKTVNIAKKLYEYRESLMDEAPSDSAKALCIFNCHDDKGLYAMCLATIMQYEEALPILFQEAEYWKEHIVWENNGKFEKNNWSPYSSSIEDCQAGIEENNYWVIKTENFIIFPAAYDEMKEIIEHEQLLEVKKEYNRHLQECFMHPEKYFRKALWLIKLKEDQNVLIGVILLDEADKEKEFVIQVHMNSETLTAEYKKEILKEFSKSLIDLSEANLIKAVVSKHDYSESQIYEEAGYTVEENEGCSLIFYYR